MSVQLPGMPAVATAEVTTTVAEGTTVTVIDMAATVVIPVQDGGRHCTTYNGASQERAAPASSRC